MKNTKIKPILKHVLVFAFITSVFCFGSLVQAGIVLKSTLKSSGDPVTVTMWNNLVKDISNINLALDGKLSLGVNGNIVASMPIDDNHVATKAYVDAQSNGFPIDSTGCFEGSELILRWNATDSGAEYRCYDIDPDDFSFTEKIGEANTVITSDIVQITGILLAPVKISRNSLSQFRICSDVSCDTVVEDWGNEEKNISNEQYLQLKITVSNSCSTQNNVSISIGSNNNTWPILPNCVGQQAYTSPGTYSWTAPANVTKVSVVAVGGGGGGCDGWTNYSGGGGGLGWKNNISVVPGQNYTVVVGAGGNNSTTGGNSYFINSSTVAGYGGGNNCSGATGGPNNNSYGGGYVGDGGGAGGNVSSYQGGGGAGGYSGRGGNMNEHPTPAGGGGHAGCYYSSTYGSGGGGGVGILGEGPSGQYFYTPWSPTSTNAGQGGGGLGGSGGDRGCYGENPWNSTGEGGNSNCPGGNYGGGGGASGSSWTSNAGVGGSGAVRIIWGNGRAFPATNTADM